MVLENDSNDGENGKPHITAYIPHKDSNGRTPEERLARLQNSDEMIRLSKAERIGFPVRHTPVMMTCY